MMDAEARLAAALGASAAPPRDPRFTLGVIRAAEAGRYRAKAALSVLRWGGLAGLGAVMLLIAAGWTTSDFEGFQSGILGAAAIFALVALARLMTQRLAPAATR